MNCRSVDCSYKCYSYFTMHSLELCGEIESLQIELLINLNYSMMCKVLSLKWLMHFSVYTCRFGKELHWLRICGHYLFLHACAHQKYSYKQNKWFTKIYFHILLSFQCSFICQSLIQYEGICSLCCCDWSLSWKF